MRCSVGILSCSIFPREFVKLEHTGVRIKRKVKLNGKKMKARGLPSLVVLCAAVLMMGGGVEGERKLTHPAFTGAATLTLKVIYW